MSPWLREDFWLSHVFQLNASDLLSRSGFQDGNLLDEMLGDHGYVHSIEEKHTGALNGERSLNNTYHIVLIELGRKYLFPFIEELGPWPHGLDVMYIHETSHNPLRCEGFWKSSEIDLRAECPGFFDIEVGVPGRKVLELADLVYPKDLRKDYIV